MIQEYFSHRLGLIFYLASLGYLLSFPLSASAQKQQYKSPISTTINPQTIQQSQSTGPDSRVTVNTDLISFNVTVMDQHGKFVSGLNKRAFTVFDEKQPQEITFFNDDDAPVSVGIIFDLSGSMRGKKTERAREALARFIQTSHPQDEYSLIGFSSHTEVLIDRTRDANAVLDKITRVEPHGNTAMYDAIYLGIEKLQRGAYPKQVLLLITDGGENDSRYTFKEVRNSLEESGVLLYSICTLDQINLAGKEGKLVRDTLKELSDVTGGKAFYPQSGSEMEKDFEQIALELRHQYSIGYKPRNFISDGRWHRVRVKVTPPSEFARLIVRSRQGYQALTRTR